jgi:hypothetical protein
MEAIIWILVIIAVLVIIILTVITSVGKLSDKFADTYIKDKKMTEDGSDSDFKNESEIETD